MIRRNVELESQLIDDLLDLTRIARDKTGFAAATRWQRKRIWRSGPWKGSRVSSPGCRPRVCPEGPQRRPLVRQLAPGRSRRPSRTQPTMGGTASVDAVPETTRAIYQYECWHLKGPACHRADLATLWGGDSDRPRRSPSTTPRPAGSAWSAPAYLGRSRTSAKAAFQKFCS